MLSKTGAQRCMWLSNRHIANGEMLNGENYASHRRHGHYRNNEIRYAMHGDLTLIFRANINYIELYSIEKDETPHLSLLRFLFVKLEW